MALAPFPDTRPYSVSGGGDLSQPERLGAIIRDIHDARHIDEIIFELSESLRTLFEAERITIFVPNNDGNIVSKVARHLNASQRLKLPTNAKSIAGYVAQEKVIVNIANVYDDAELKRISPNLRFLKALDTQTGFFTRQVLAFPVLSPDSDKLMAVIELLNSLNGQPFSPAAEAAAIEVSKPLGIAFNPRRAPRGLAKTRFWPLIAQNALSVKDMEQAFRRARSKKIDIESLLLDEFHIDPEEIGLAYASFFGVPFEPFSPSRVQPLTLQRSLTQDYVLANEWLPMDESVEEGLVILTPEPEKVRNSHIVNQAFPKRTRITYKVCLKRDFINTIDLLYGMTDISTVLDRDDEEGRAMNLVSEQDNELVKLINRIIVEAYNQGASDIHIEPYPDRSKTDVRFRKDGTLVHFTTIPPSYRNAIVSRIKIMCDLDISERRKPQDGKIKFKKFGPLDIELRVATIPTSGGLEDVVIRILAGGAPLPMEKLGLSARNESKLREMITKPYGLFIVCGPTGSGKTTTLHSALSYINTSETKIWTAEDPVEITQKGLRQVQINYKAGVDFATVMKAFLRADPDVIMVGEMRDRETAAIGIEASLTGHLVLTTLHTNSAPESVVRLLDMGIDPFNFADALLGVLAQRLAKRLCDCKQAYIATADDIMLLLREYCLELEHTNQWKKDPAAAIKAVQQDWISTFSDANGQFTLYRPVGCKKCDHTGYKGRIGLYELMEGTPAIKKNLQNRAHVTEMFATALEDGMRTLKQDGIEKVLRGITDIKQVRAVCIR
ncbi:type II secretion system protein E [mine drainage metagenome]|uniref:Type II secretion system protein E n=1 Tax=mine drainage metagenome TaxID=410659 RepID=A0A1J5QQQ0_9ZZZZ